MTTNKWSPECVEILRNLINDVSDTPTYTNDRLERLLIVAALQVSREVDFIYNYTINVSEVLISPDPSDPNSRDNAFLNLVCLKAAVVLLDSELRYYAISSLRITDGPSSIDSSSRATFVKIAANNMQDRYVQMKLLHQAGQAGVAIMTPTTVPYLCPETRFS